MIFFAQYLCPAVPLCDMLTFTRHLQGGWYSSTAAGASQCLHSPLDHFWSSCWPLHTPLSIYLSIFVYRAPNQGVFASIAASISMLWMCVMTLWHEGSLPITTFGGLQAFWLNHALICWYGHELLLWKIRHVVVYHFQLFCWWGSG